jgi:hypothetical protein
MNIKDQPRSFSYYIGYILCRDLFIFASKNYNYIETTSTEKNKFLKRLLLSAEVYGIESISDSLLVSQHKFNIKNRSLDENEFDKNYYAQPKQVFDRDLKYGKIPKVYMDFDISKSEVFNIGGDITKKFI